MNQNQTVRQTNRVAEMILGILGSIFGILGGLFAIMLDGIGAEFGATESGSITGLGIAVILTCIIKSTYRSVAISWWHFKYRVY